MERLTIMTPKGYALRMNETYPDENATRKDLMQKYRIAVDRLDAYEDTGLSPEEYANHADATKKLDIEHMHDLLQAEKAGRLAALEKREEEAHEPNKN